MTDPLTTTLAALVRRYRYELPLGNQPHMIAQDADEALALFDAAQQVAGEQALPPYTSERHFALREGHEHRAEEDYFSARPKFDDSIAARSAFSAGYVRGFDKATGLADARAAQAAQPLPIHGLLFDSAMPPEVAQWLSANPPRNMVPVRDERAAFEVWASEQKLAINRHRHSYAATSTAWCWDAWQARAALAQQPAPEAAKGVPSDEHLMNFLAPWCISDDPQDQRDFLAALRAALRATPPAPEAQQAQHDREIEEALTERDEATDFIDALLDEVLGTDRAEWSSNYGRADALEEVQERMAALLKPEPQQPAQAVPLSVPQPGSPEASAMIDSELALRGWPANHKNAARAGYEACRKLAGLGVKLAGGGEGV